MRSVPESINDIAERGSKKVGSVHKPWKA